ncbi:MAG: hypothetical protein QXJ21_03630 [Thermofilum sp.]
MRRKPSLVKIAQRLILSMPYIIEAMKLNIVNYSSLARLLKEDMERLSGRKLGEGSVKIAVLRAVKSLLEEYPPPERLSRALRGSELRVVEGLSVLSVAMHEGDKLLEGLSQVEKAKFVQFIQGFSAFTVVAEESVASELLSRVNSRNVLQYLREQAAIILTGPPDILVTPGVVSHLAMSLSSRGINLTEVLSSYRDVIFVVSRSDVGRAVEVIRNLLEVLERSAS